MSTTEFSWSDNLADRAARLQPSAIREILKLTQKGDVISFAGGLPAPNLFPRERIRQATERVLKTNGTAALQYSTTEGHPPLREWIASRYTGVDADDVQVISGSQQGLDLVAKCFLDPGDSVIVAAPTYTGALRAFDPYEVRFRGVEIDDDGIVPDALEQALAEGAKLIYVIPNFDNPSGTSLSLERRHQVVELARRHRVPILEDNPYGELRFAGDDLPHLFDLAPELVIHAGTFSKTLVPGFRLAWLIVRDEARTMTARAKQATDLHTSTFVQMIAAEAAADGFLDEHVKDARDYYHRQRDLMLDGMKRHFPAEASWTTPDGGMFLWVTLPDRVDTSALAYKAVDAGVAYVPGEAFFAHGYPRDSLRLSYSVATPNQIEVGISALGRVLQEALKKA